MSEREDLTFPSGEDTCAAWLYRPDGAEGPVPCIVMAHGFTATREDRLPAYAERFAAAGMAVLLFDYRHFGDSTGEPRRDPRRPCGGGDGARGDARGGRRARAQAALKTIPMSSIRHCSTSTPCARQICSIASHTSRQ